jgi:hypothetical protein
MDAVAERQRKHQLDLQKQIRRLENYLSNGDAPDSKSLRELERLKILLTR